MSWIVGGDGERNMYVKLYNIEPQIQSTLVKREARKDGFDLFMPLFYKKSCIPYKSCGFIGPLNLRSGP